MSAGAKGDPAARGDRGGASPEGLPGWQCHRGAVRDRGAGGAPFLGAAWDRGGGGSPSGAPQDRGASLWGSPCRGSVRAGAPSAAVAGPGSVPRRDPAAACGLGQPGPGVPRGVPTAVPNAGPAICAIVSGCGVSGYLSVIVRPWSTLGHLSYHIICISVKSVPGHLCF